MVNDTEKVIADAAALAESISRNDRIQQLAANPLLLTTLLLVKRWVGVLPTRRAVLYGKAVELLLMTWNTEGHDPIPQEDALPQLCYVASAMMLDGVQKVSRPRLRELLIEARKALPTELGFVKESPDTFIERVEYRSSLLMMTGLDVENGQLVEFFEFRHLTFQEFLTARAMVEGWHPGRKETDTLASVLEPHFDEEKWREVIPLAAVLGRGATDGLIQRLTGAVAKLDRDKRDSGRIVFLAHSQSLADEAAARPETIRAALRELVRLGDWLYTSAPSIRSLATGKYKTEFREEARHGYFSPSRDLLGAACALSEAVWYQTDIPDDAAGQRNATQTMRGELASDERMARCEGALFFSRLAFDMGLERLTKGYPPSDILCEIGPSLAAMLQSDSPTEQHAASLALAWLGECQFWPPTVAVLERLYQLWRWSSEPEIRRVAAWALATQPLNSRDESTPFTGISAAEFQTIAETSFRDSMAVLVLAWYRRAPWDDAELGRRVIEAGSHRVWGHSSTPRDLAKRLGVSWDEKPPATAQT